MIGGRKNNSRLPSPNRLSRGTIRASDSQPSCQCVERALLCGRANLACPQTFTAGLLRCGLAPMAPPSPCCTGLARSRPPGPAGTVCQRSRRVRCRRPVIRRLKTVSYQSEEPIQKEREQSVVSKPLIVLLNCFCILMVRIKSM